MAGGPCARGWAPIRRGDDLTVRPGGRTGGAAGADTGPAEAHHGEVTQRPPRDPEPVVIELVPLDGSPADAGAWRDRPPPAGVGTLPSATTVLAALVTRALDTPDPPLVRSSGPGGAWPDLRVHRLVRLAPHDAARGLHAALLARDGRIVAAAPGRPPRSRRGPNGPPGYLEVLGRTGTWALAAALHVHRHGRATPVEIVLEPWSAHRTDLCLEVRRRPGRTGLHLPRRYFDVAHRVMDELWHQIEANAAA